jgi:hypothetical protein
MTIASGTKLGRDGIRSKIGEGGVGDVYLAQDTSLRRQGAIKILPTVIHAEQSSPVGHGRRLARRH